MAAVLPEAELKLETSRRPGDRPGRSTGRDLPIFDAGGLPRRRLYIRACQVADTAVALVSLVAALLLTNLGHMPTGLDGFLAVRITLEKLLLVCLFLLVWQTSFGLSGLYDWNRPINLSQELSSAAAASTVGSVCSLIFVLRSSSGAFGVGTALYFWLAATGLVLLSRTILHALALDSATSGSRDVIIVGSGPRASRLYRQLVGDRPAECNVLGFVDSNDAIPDDEIGRRLLGKLDQLESILMHRALDEVVIALPMRSSYSAIQNVIQVCERVGVRAKYLADVFPTALARPRFEESRNFPAVSLAIAPEDGRLIVKRLIDIIGSVVALVVLSPLMLMTALAIKLTSPGPVLFSQERLALNRRRFRMYKFRTMRADAEACQETLEHLNEAGGPIFKIKNDPRMTRIGRFLRRSSIDELPQLFHVLRGEMSLVGPRPMAVRDVIRFTEAATMRRFSMRPGLTCLWQIEGRSNLSFEEWMRLDLRYIDGWSLSGDFRILLRTVPAVLGGVGAS
jgi:exopolysaccharide biosynthesis polyprenyl glycosylphosphotransferase